MKSIFSQISKLSLFNHVMRLAIIVVCLSYSAAANARYTYFYARVYVHKAENTGSGKVYVTSDANKTPSDSDYKEISAEDNSVYADDQGQKGQDLGTGDSNVYFYLFAKASTGYYMDGWSKNSDGSEPVGNSNVAKYEVPPFTPESTDEENPDKVHYYAIFKEQTAYRDYAAAEAVMVNASNVPVVDNNNEYLQSYYKVSIGDKAAAYSPTYGDKSVKGIDANPEGKWGYTYTASSSVSDYKFVGWYEGDATGNLIIEEQYNRGDISPYNSINYNKSKTLYSDAVDNPTQAPIAKKVYALFNPNVYLYPYDAETDQFSQDAYTSAPDQNGCGALFSDMTSGVGERLYRILHNFGDFELTVSSEGDFQGRLEEIEGMMVLRANPTSTSSDLSGQIIISIGQTPIAKLEIKVSNEPVIVTLNPAKDLYGTYKYTQNTTGSKEFEVTNMPVEKVMVTSTDYSFTFNPSPRDASMMRFDRWVIEDKYGNVSELYTANLSYRFAGGESITPIFIPTDVATYIVKSEPNITYVNLQKALDRADALTTAGHGSQTVVVTSATGKLLQGNYTIRNGVTLLIPGESTYTALLGDLSESHFAESGTFKTYCTLTVEDNTTITVENGNISLYAKLSITNTSISGKGVAYEHGHLELGKNCQITIHKGGLYAFGFVTGDSSSKIIMKSGTEVYEPFHMRDWRGGSETIGNWAPDVPMMGGDAGVKARVFPIGQYYVQSVEVPLVFEYGSRERLSCCVDATVTAAVNMTYISTYSDECLFGIGTGATLIKSYDPLTDRVKYEFKGNGASSKVKLGCMNLKMSVSIYSVDVNSKDFVMPIQNNIDVDVKNATIDVQYDMAFMPGSTMRVHDDAAINIGSSNASDYKPNVYIYDRGARLLNDGTPYWQGSTAEKPILPVVENFRPGNIKYKRTDVDLVDARLIVNGDMNLYGALYTVKGAHADDEGGADPKIEGGAAIMSEGSGKINMYSYLGTATSTKQWKYQNGAQTLALTTPNLKLRNDLSKGADSAYTHVTLKNVSYTYYQHDGMWRLPQPGVTGVKLYDSMGNEIDNFLVTLPTTSSVDGYLLATLESISGVTYNETDFTATISTGGIDFLGGNEIQNGKLKIPVRYTTKNVHGTHTQTLTIKYSGCADCDLVTPISAIEDYTPVFKAPASLNIYARIHERTPGSLPIVAESSNVVSLAENSSVKLTWEAVIEGTNKTMFEFGLGEVGNKLAGASVFFTPNNTTQRTATLKLTAKYTDSEDNVITSETHVIPLTGNGLMIENTMDFNNVGTITVNTSEFELLSYINSTGKITYTVLEGTVNQASSPINIASVDANANSNFTITPKAVGQVKLQVSQEGTTTHTEKTITTTLIVVADPQPLTTEVCLDNNNFSSLTADIEHAKYEDNKLKFEGDGAIASWTAQFSTMPGTMTFTPHGDGYWAVQESKDGINWSEIIWWTQLPKGKSVTLALHPTTRRVKISYNKLTEDGYISQLCITPFTVHAETTKIYAPVVNGLVQPTSVEFTHSTPSVTFAGPSSWTVSPQVGSTTNLGGVLNTYYKTTVTVSGGTNVEELNDGFELKAIQGADEAVVTIGTYNFPKPLPVESENWVSDGDETNNINDYDESEYYFHYMCTSKNVKWDAERKNLVFLNVGSKTGDDAVRQVVFGYFGLPDVVRFQSATTDWTIEQSTDGTTWNPVNTEASTVNTTGEIESASQYVRITYSGDTQDEVLINNLVIEGLPSAVPDTTEVVINKSDASVGELSETFTIQVRNIPQIKLLLDNTTAFSLHYQSGSNWLPITDVLTSEQYENLAVNKEGELLIKAVWNGAHMVDEGYVQILNPNQNDSVMAIVHIIGKKDVITASDLNTGIWTGVPDGNGTTKEVYELESTVFSPYTYHQVNLKNAFANGKALFNYLIIFGETTTIDGGSLITQPTETKGSNALTPFYVYKKENDSYKFVQAIANANVSDKALAGDVIVKDDSVGAVYIDVTNAPTSVYMTGFCPYATTGYVKNQEGVFLFRGKHGSKLDVYLDSCHIYSRNKTNTGQAFKGKEGGEIFSDGFARGSGGVLVFENVDPQEQLADYLPFEVSIHTDGDNVLNSNYGCFFGLALGNDIAMKATQVSSPIQVHMYKEEYARKTQMTLNFSDKWPSSVDANGNVTDSVSTNGFLALKKQANNAPSIDLGNPYTVVNFRGGQVELQNSQIGSDTYKTTLAISYRSGLFGADGAGIKLCYGIGTDAVDGTVNFIDGTVTVERMKVDEAYRQYYLMDTLSDGTESEYTTCLRTPKNTYIKGGSICRVRACQHVTSKGGAPKEGVDGRLLGQYVYTASSSAGDVEKENGTYTIQGFPSNISGLESYTYGLSSITPDASGKCYFWIPDGFGGVTAEKDLYMSTWKACMTKIGAGIAGIAEGEVGGDIEIGTDEEVKYFLYCQLDDNIYNVINAGEVAADGKKKYTYKAPIEVPSAAREYFKGDYTRWAPNEVGLYPQHQVLSEDSYTIQNRVYYITTATADLWKTFTAPFDVENIYVVETFSEEKLQERGTRAQILEQQATHNADFAAFFGVAMAMGTDKSFEEIYDSYIKWATIMDKDSFLLYNPSRDGEYTLRGKTKLIPYYGSNWRDANFYLNVNNGNWVPKGGDSYEVKWEMLPDTAMADTVLLHKGKTYSLMFPYCTGCELEFSERDYWDYWSGKFLIFEGVDKPQTINGSDFLDESAENTVFVSPENENEVVVTGNSTFAYLTTDKSNVYRYVDGYPSMAMEQFKPVTTETTINPTTAFLYGNVPTRNGMPAKAISRSGQIIYDKENTPTGNQGGNIPTVGGGNDLFITSTIAGINIAVAEPQHVRVMSATGALLFNGMVQTSVDVALPTNGVYVITGENEVHKILH